MTDELQALCFLAGANSIVIGDVLLTTKNPQRDRDASLLARLGISSRLANPTSSLSAESGLGCEMQITLMRGTIRRASVTEADLCYEVRCCCAGRTRNSGRCTGAAKVWHALH